MDSESYTILKARIDALEAQNRELLSRHAHTPAHAHPRPSSPLLMSLVGGSMTLLAVLVTAWVLGAVPAIPFLPTAAKKPVKGNFASSVNIRDEQSGKILVDMLSTESGAGGFQVWDRQGRCRILLGTNDHGQAGLTFWDEDGKITDRFWQTLSSK